MIVIVTANKNLQIYQFRKLAVTLTVPNTTLTLAIENKPEQALRCGEIFKPKIIFSSSGDEEFELHYTALSKGNIVKTGLKKIIAGKKADYNPYQNEDTVEIGAVDEVCFCLSINF